MSRQFREWQPDAGWLFPPSPRDWLSAGHPVYFLLDVTAQIDISPIVDDYDSGNGGQPPFHPRMMLVLLLYAYSVGVFSSRKIMQRCVTDAERLQQEIDALLARAKAADTDDDDQFGDLAGDEIPDELKRRETRLAKIPEAKQALEEAARQKAQAHVDKMEAEGRRHRTNPEEAVPDPKAQRNFTDPESKIMKTSNKGFDQCGNAQAVANEQQIIIAADVTDQANDVRQTVPMTDQAIDNLDAAGVSENIGAFTADAGYFSEENMNALDSNDRIDDAFIATGRQKHNDKVPDSPKGRPPKNLTPKQKMARRNRTKKGRTEYARRKVILEPVFGQIKECLGFRNFLLRGLEKMQGEWTLVCVTHNLLKLFRSGALAAG